MLPRWRLRKRMQPGGCPPFRRKGGCHRHRLGPRHPLGRGSQQRPRHCWLSFGFRRHHGHVSITSPPSPFLMKGEDPTDPAAQQRPTGRRSSPAAGAQNQPRRPCTNGAQSGDQAVLANVLEPILVLEPTLHHRLYNMASNEVRSIVVTKRSLVTARRAELNWRARRPECWKGETYTYSWSVITCHQSTASILIRTPDPSRTLAP